MELMLGVKIQTRERSFTREKILLGYSSSSLDVVADNVAHLPVAKSAVSATISTRYS
jgi:hypothetical protein